MCGMDGCLLYDAWPHANEALVTLLTPEHGNVFNPSVGQSSAPV